MQVVVLSGVVIQYNRVARLQFRVILKAVPWLRSLIGCNWAGSERVLFIRQLREENPNCLGLKEAKAVIDAFCAGQVRESSGDFLVNIDVSAYAVALKNMDLERTWQEYQNQ
jgi:hypothetical protein